MQKTGLKKLARLFHMLALALIIQYVVWPDLQHSAQFPSSEVHQEVSEVSKDVWAGAHFTLKIKIT